MEQNRFKSKIVWAAIAAQILAIGQMTGLFAKYGIDAGVVGDIVAAVLQIGVLVGVLNNSIDAKDF